MNKEFALQLADLRLLQTSHLLKLSLDGDHDREALDEALAGIHASRTMMETLLDGLPGIVRTPPAAQPA